MSKTEIEILKSALEREKSARKQAEQILEQKSRNLLMISRELKIANQKLTKLLDEKSTELKGVFENINDAYIVINLSGDAIKMNDIARELFQHYSDPKELNIGKLIYSKDVPYAKASFDKLLNEGSFVNFTSRIITNQKEKKWVQINASLIYNQNNKPIAAQGIVRDVTQIKELELQKEKIRNELEESNNQLQEYAHVVSHDLKSPLRSLHALTSWIKADNEASFDEMTRENFVLVENTLETMDSLISNVLEYSSAGYEIDEQEQVDLQFLLSDLKKVLFIPEHINLVIQKDLPIINAEKVKIQQIFQNLISNSIKFIDKEKGIIQINCKEEKTFYEFSIKDNGIGIDEKYHNKIFNIFQSLNKTKESTGVGLSIVKKIVKLYGGEIWLESKPNEGTTFYFTLKK